MGLLDRLESKGGGALDRLENRKSSLDRLEETAGGLAGLEGRSRRSTVDPNIFLNSALGTLTEEEKDRHYLSRVIHNAPHDIVEFLSGAKYLLTKGAAAAWDVGVRAPFNAVTGDSDEVAEIMDRYRTLPGAIKEGVVDEVRRYAEVYGSAAAFTSTLGQAGSLEPLKEQFAEDPLFTLMDVAAFGKAATTPLRLSRASNLGKVAASTKGSTPLRAIPGAAPPRAGKYVSLFDRMRSPELTTSQLLRETVTGPEGQTFRAGTRVRAGQQIEATTGKATRNMLDDPKRAALFEVATNPEYKTLTLAERAEEVRRLTPIMGENVKRLKSATILGKMDETVQNFSNPFRLAYMTIGKTPLAKRVKEVMSQKSIALGIVSSNTRLVQSLQNLFKEDHLAGMQAFTKLEESSKRKVIRIAQSLDGEINDLTPDELAGYTGLVMSGRRFRPEAIRVLTAKGDMTVAQANDLLDRRVMSNAIRGQIDIEFERHAADIDAGGSGTLTKEQIAVLEPYKKLGAVDKLVKRYDEVLARVKELTKEVETNWSPAAGTVAELEAKSMELQLLDQARERLARNELAFIPGQRDFVNIEKLGMSDELEFIAGDVTELDELQVRKMKRKTDIVTDPMAVEAHMLRYADFMAHMQGQLKLTDEIKAVGTVIAKEDMQHYLYEYAANQISGKSDGFVPVILHDGTGVRVPEGMEEVFKKAFEPDKPGVASKVIDFTKQEWSNVVLGANPGWVAYNILGNIETFTMALGNPTMLARTTGLKLADSVYHKFFESKGKHPVGVVSKMLQDASTKWRTIIPQSQALGMSVAQTRRFGGVEYYTHGEIAWGESSAARLATKYSRATEKVTDTIGLRKLNEGIEEVFRSALWLSTAERRLAAKRFFETGKIMMGANAMRNELIDLAEELDPQKLLIPGPMRLSDDVIHVRDTVNRFMNDYYRLGPVERKLFRRVFPFYSWTKFINRLAVELPMYHPMRASIGAFTTNAVNDARAMDETLPEWLRDAVIVKEHDDGTVTYQTGTAEIFQGVMFGKEGFDRAVLGLNPMFKVPIEFLTGINMMRGGANRVAPSRAADGIVQDFTGRGTYRLGEHGLEESRARPTVPMALLRSGLVPIPAWNEWERAIRGGPHDDIGSVTELAIELGNILTGQPRAYPGAYLDQVTKKPYTQGPPQDAAGGAFGLPRHTFDPENLRERELERKTSAAKRIIKERLNEDLRKLGF